MQLALVASEACLDEEGSIKKRSYQEKILAVIKAL